MVLLATGAHEMPWNKAIHEAMRLTLKADPTLEQGDGSQGLQAARAIGMLNYRTAAQFNDAQPDDSEALEDFKAPSISGTMAKSWWIGLMRHVTIN